MNTLATVVIDDVVAYANTAPACTSLVMVDRLLMQRKRCSKRPEAALKGYMTMAVLSRPPLLLFPQNLSLLGMGLPGCSQRAQARGDPAREPNPNTRG